MPDPQTRRPGGLRGVAAWGAVTSLLLLASCSGIDLGAGLTSPPQAAPEPGAVAALDRLSVGRCNEEVASSLAGAGIPIADVRGLTYGLHRDFDRGNIVGYDAWVALANQPGAVIVQLDEYCTPRQIYARDGARLPARIGGAAPGPG